MGDGYALDLDALVEWMAEWQTDTGPWELLGIDENT